MEISNFLWKVKARRNLSDFIIVSIKTETIGRSSVI